MMKPNNNALYLAEKTTGLLTAVDEESLALRFFGKGNYPELESRAQLILQRWEHILA